MTKPNVITSHILTLIDRVKAGMTSKPGAAPTLHHGLVTVNRARPVARDAAVPAYRQHRSPSRRARPFRVELPR